MYHDPNLINFYAYRAIKFCYIVILSKTMHNVKKLDVFKFNLKYTVTFNQCC